MGSWGGVARHGIRAQLDDKKNKPEDSEEHWDSKLVPERDSHSKKSVQLDHLWDTKPVMKKWEK